MNNTLGRKLRIMRESNHYTQAQISARLHVERAAYSNYESGRRLPAYDTLLLIADFYKVSTDYLIRPDFTGNPHRRSREEDQLFLYFELLDPAIREALIAAFHCFLKYLAAPKRT